MLCVLYVCTFNSCNMCTCVLPDMYTLIPWACGPREFSHTYQAEHECTCYIYYWSDPHSNVESGAVAAFGTVVHVQTNMINLRILP